MNAKFARVVCLLISAVVLSIVPQFPASATYTRQVAGIAPPPEVQFLPRTGAHCTTSPDGGDLGCLYVDVNKYDEVADFTDYIEDGHLLGVHWSTPGDSGLCIEYSDAYYDGIQWCDLPNITEGTPITWKVGSCSKAYYANCRSSDWTWTQSRTHLA